MNIQEQRDKFISLKLEIEALAFQSKVYSDNIRDHELKKNPDVEIYEIRSRGGDRLTFKLSKESESFKPNAYYQVKAKYYEMDAEFWNERTKKTNRHWKQSETKVVVLSKVKNKEENVEDKLINNALSLLLK